MTSTTSGVIGGVDTRQSWATREQLANAVSAFIEGFYNLRQRHSTLGYLSPADHERQHLAEWLTKPPHDARRPTRPSGETGTLQVTQ